MYYSTQHCVGGGNVWSETFKGQSFPQLAHAHGQNTAVPFDDVPQENGQLSNALKQKLADEGLLDIGGNLQVPWNPHQACLGEHATQGVHSVSKNGTQVL